VLKASTRLVIAAALSFGAGIAAYLYFTGSHPFSKSTPLTVTIDCGGFLIDDPQAELLRKDFPSESERAKLEEKIACYRRQISQEPRYADAYTNIGEASRRLGEVAAAKQAHEKALQLNPRLQEAKLGLALVEQQSGDSKAAIEKIQEIVAQKESATAYFYQGTALHQQAKLPEAETAFRKALEQDPSYAEARVNLGLILNQQGKFDAAVNEFKQAIRNKPKLAEAHFNLGVTLQAQGQLEPAIAAYREAINIDPNNAEANYNLGIALNKQGKAAEAMAAYKQAISINPDYAKAYVKLGGNLTDEGRIDEAIASLQKALTLNPKDPEAYNNMGVALHKQNNLPGAISMWEEAIRLNSNYAEAHHNMGVALAGQGKLEEAISTLKQASQLYRSQNKTQKADQIDAALQKIGAK
jgi:tetratricopeptide (TPR) repeat protein